ncbi:MAG: MATE family efflux transporter [Lachnospiraceae bacterium]|nr:MATE family efflux transporter [Lachnospiraceae bacterium]
MTEGPIMGKMVRYSLPLILSSILQLLFNAADVIVVGRFAGAESLAAVGSTGSLTSLILNLFIGLSIGTNVLVARNLGARDDEETGKVVHTSILLSLIGGAFLAVVGVVLARPMLQLMGSPEDVIDKSVLYMQIYFLGMPVNMLYNFGSAVMRAQGDTKRPLYFLTISGVVNVILNLFMVIVLHMGVAGVAVATVVSQAISALLVVRSLMHMEGPCHLDLKQLKIHKGPLLGMIHVGLPAGLQGIVFSISNVLIQSSINSFGSVAMAGSTAAANIEGFVYVGMNAVYQTALSFSAQNMGAGKYDRLNKITAQSLILVTIIGAVLSGGAYLLRYTLLAFYTDSAEVVRYGCMRLQMVCLTYTLCGLMDTMVGNLRGLGYQVMPMVVSLTGACGFRVFWILTVFAANRTMSILYACYPISWALTFMTHLICYIIVKRKFDKKISSEAQLSLVK